MSDFAVQSIIETLRNAQANQLAQQNLAQQSKAEADRIQSQKDQLAESTRQFNLSHDLAVKNAMALRAAHNLAAAQASANLGKQYSETGIAPANSTVAPQAQTPQGLGYSPINPNDPNTTPNQTLNLPGAGSSGEDLNIPVIQPKAYATQQADLQRITLKPGEEARQAAEEAKQAAEAVRQLQVKAADAERYRMQEEARTQQAQEATAARLQMAQDHNDTMRFVAGLAHDSRLQPATDITPYIEQGKNGTLSSEDLNKIPGISKQDKVLINNAILSTGNTLINDKQKNLLMNFKPILTTIPNLDHALELLKTNPAEVRIPGTAAYKAYEEDMKQVDKTLPNIARVIEAQSGRLSNQQIKYSEGSFKPDKSLIGASYATNVKNRNDFVRTINEILKTQLAGMSPERQAVVKASYGITTGNQVAPANASQDTHIYYDSNGNPRGGPQVK